MSLSMSVCHFAQEYPVLFNPTKSKLITFNCASTGYVYVTFAADNF